jgi:hypothetical protein
MSETDNAPPDVANALVAQLESEAAFVDAGSFTLDPRKAREKLAAHQLAEPERYVLLLVEAAHLLPNCMDVAFTISRGFTRVVFGGVELRGDELQSCFDALFIDVAGLEPERARRIRGRQRLALALNSALGLRNARVEMVSSIAGDAFVHVILDAGARVQTHTESAISRTSKLVVDVYAATRRRKLRDLLRRDARHATLPVYLDRVRIDEDPAAALVAPVDLRDAKGQIVGRAGWCAAQARQPSGSVELVDNGIVVESYAEPELPSGMLVLLDADDLQRDISYAKLQRDEAFSQRVAVVATSCDALSQPPPMLGPEPTEEGEIIWRLFCFVAGALITAYSLSKESFLGILIGAFVFVAGLPGVHGSPLSIGHAVRRREVRMHGDAALGVILIAYSTGSKRGTLRELAIQMRIERAGQADYDASFLTLIDSGFVHLIEPGKRIYVRIDPDDRNFVVLDAGDASTAAAQRAIGESPSRR